MTRTKQAALGCRAHSGWAALVAIGGSPRSPEVLMRRRIELIRPGTPKQPYHAAENLPLERARKLIEHSSNEARILARQAFREAIVSLRPRQHAVVSCGVLFTSHRRLPELASILKSHPLLHTAEGQHFRSALAQAGKDCKLRVAQIQEKAAFEVLAGILRISIPELQARVLEMGRALGPPWTQDEKYATAAAWASLLGASFSAED